MHNKQLTYLSVCSGIEAASVAWHDLNLQPVGFSEIEAFPCAVLKTRFPNVINYGDLTKHESWPIESGTVNIVCGGTPCQSFSVAGLRAGMADPRGNLALAFVSLCNRLQPEWVIWENVPGVLSTNNGNDFKCFINALVECGYHVAWRILDAQFFGVAQRRRRIFVVANRIDWRRCAAVLFEPESLSGDIAKGRKARKSAAASFRNGAETIGTICADSHPGSYSGQDAYTGRLIPAPLPFVKAKRAASIEDDETWHADRPAPTLSVFDSGDSRATVAIVAPETFAVRRLTPVECERLQGFPDNWTDIIYKGKPAADGPRYKAIGNSMAVPVMRWLGQRIQAVDSAIHQTGFQF